jgi:hypothetical protein
MCHAMLSVIAEAREAQSFLKNSDYIESFRILSYIPYIIFLILEGVDMKLQAAEPRLELKQCHFVVSYLVHSSKW